MLEIGARDGNRMVWEGMGYTGWMDAFVCEGHFDVQWLTGLLLQPFQCIGDHCMVPVEDAVHLTCIKE